MIENTLSNIESFMTDTLEIVAEQKICPITTASWASGCHKKLQKIDQLGSCLHYYNFVR